jgi:hypothetical protein
MTPPADYSLRATHRPKPEFWVDPYADITPLAHAELAAGPVTFFADISTYQPLVNSSYPYPVLGFRADTGTSTDSHAAGNWAYADAHPDRLRVLLPYIVFKPGEAAGIQQRLKDLFGVDCPPRVALEIDMESGVDFAGPGNHSSEANDLIGWAAQWSGSQLSTEGYANDPDWAGCWPSRPAWMKRRIADYSSSPTPAGFYARQYYGALPYPSPAGWPRSCAPFGGYVDMNAIPRSITQIEADFGIGDADMPLTGPDVNAVVAGVKAMLQIGGVLTDNNTQTEQLEAWMNGKFGALATAIAGIHAGQLDEAALAAALLAAGFSDQLARSIAAHVTVTLNVK